jgi:hypothetical protein
MGAVLAPDDSSFAPWAERLMAVAGEAKEIHGADMCGD